MALVLANSFGASGGERVEFNEKLQHHLPHEVPRAAGPGDVVRTENYGGVRRACRACRVATVVLRNTLSLEGCCGRNYRMFLVARPLKLLDILDR